MEKGLARSCQGAKVGGFNNLLTCALNMGLRLDLNSYYHCIHFPQAGRLLGCSLGC